MKKRVVIKYGGHAMDSAKNEFASSVKRLMQANYEVVIVHGGGPQINDLLKRLSIASNFLNGLRVTDEATMQVVEMVLCGSVNKTTVSLFLENGIKTIGLSGKDSKILEANTISAELGLVGEVKKVNIEPIELLLANNYLVVLAPVAYGQNGQSLNINADLAAGSLAGALGADYFILVTDVPGVLDANKQLIPKLSKQEVEDLKSNGVISGGMIPKVDSCLFALEANCKEAIILDGRNADSLDRFLLFQEQLGTSINA